MLKVVRDEGRFAVAVFVERGRFLGGGSDIRKLPVVPHAFDEERPARGLLVQLIGKLQPRGIGRTKLVDLGGGVLAHGGDLRLGFKLRGLHGRAALLGHELILGHARARDEGGDDRAGGRRGVRVGSDADNQVRRGVSLRHKERIDPAALADERDVGVDALADGFQEGEICGAGQVPVLGIADNEVEDVFVGRQLNDGGVPDARVDLDDLIGRVLYLQNGRGRAAGRSGASSWAWASAGTSQSVTSAVAIGVSVAWVLSLLGGQWPAARCASAASRPYRSTASARRALSRADDV